MKNYWIYWQYADRRGGNSIQVSATDPAHAIAQAIEVIDLTRPLKGMQMREIV